MPQWTCYRGSMDDGKQEAFLEYALDSDLDTIANFWQHCETQAAVITDLITTMERYGFEDGNLAIPMISEEIKEKFRLNDIRLREIHDAAGGCFVSSQRLKDLGYAEERCKIVQDYYAFRYGILRQLKQKRRGKDLIHTQHLELYYQRTRIINMLFDDVKCFPLTRHYLLSLYRTSVRHEMSGQYGETRSTSPVAEWREHRRILWEICDLLHDRAERAAQRKIKKSQAGQPRDQATSELVHWAFGQGISIDELARMLVELDLDKERKGDMARMLAEEELDNEGTSSIAARIRREKKRLLQSQRNQEKFQAKNTVPVGI